MGITTQLKADGRFFWALINLGCDGEGFQDAYPPLERDKTYWGYLIEGAIVGEMHYVEYSESISAKFRGDELEELPRKFRLVRVI